MARPKKELETKTETITEEVVVENTKEKDLEIERLRKEKEETDKQMLELKAQMDLILKQMAMKPQVAVSQQDEEIEVKCYCINGAVIVNNDASIRYEIGYQESVHIPLSELKECFKSNVNNYKDLFKKGIFVFENEEYYDIFKVRDRIDLSDDVLVEILTKQKRIPYLEEMKVLGKIDFALSNSLIYRVADLRRRGKLRDWEYNDQHAFETQFNISVDKCINQLNLLNI